MEKTCFFVCPIGDEGTPTRKRSDQTLKYLVGDICKDMDYNVIRSDKINDTDRIDQTIINHLKTSDLVIADLTENNPNVLYEVGYRTALNKPIIHIMEDGHQLPFDISGTRTIYYDLTDLDKMNDAKDKLSKTINVVCVNSEEYNESSSFNNTFDSSGNTLSLILSNLLDLKDSIENLQSGISARDNEFTQNIIQSIVSATMNKVSESTPRPNPEEMLMNTLAAAFLEDFRKNPEAALKKYSKLGGL